jgi:hypothetical protein
LFVVGDESQAASCRDCPGMVMLGRGRIRVGRAEGRRERRERACTWGAI